MTSAGDGGTRPMPSVDASNAAGVRRDPPDEQPTTVIGRVTGRRPTAWEPQETEQWAADPRVADPRMAESRVGGSWEAASREAGSREAGSRAPRVSAPRAGAPGGAGRALRGIELISGLLGGGLLLAGLVLLVLQFAAPGLVTAGQGPGWTAVGVHLGVGIVAELLRAVRARLSAPLRWLVAVLVIAAAVGVLLLIWW